MPRFLELKNILVILTLAGSSTVIGCVRIDGWNTPAGRESGEDAKPKSDVESVKSDVEREKESLTTFSSGGVELSKFLAEGEEGARILDMAKANLREKPSGQRALSYALKLQEKFDELNSLDPVEIAAIHVYTSGRHMTLNLALRNADKELLDANEGLLKALASALNKAKVLEYKGTVYRWTRLPEDALAKYVVGEYFVEKGFLSTSTMANNGFTGNVYYEIQSKSGKNIRRLAEIASEGEVLFSAGTRFKVLEVEKKSDTTVIRLEESPSH